MMSVYECATKRDLKARVGQKGDGVFQETSMFGPEYRPDGVFCVVGPAPYKRNWFAEVTMAGGIIQKVK
jgi:hypothetical protein